MTEKEKKVFDIAGIKPNVPYLLKTDNSTLIIRVDEEFNVYFRSENYLFTELPFVTILELLKDNIELSPIPLLSKKEDAFLNSFQNIKTVTLLKASLIVTFNDSSEYLFPLKNLNGLNFNNLVESKIYSASELNL